MVKKIIIAVELCISLFLFSIGFAGWYLKTSDDLINNDNGYFFTDDVYSINDVGISYGESLDKFTYCKEFNVSSNREIISFAQTALSFTINLDKNVIDSLDYEMEKLYYLEVSCYYIGDIDLFTDDSIISSPDSLMIMISDLPNLYFIEEITKSKISYNNMYLYSLDCKIPIKSYDMASLYSLSKSYNKSNNVAIKFKYQFENSSNISSENFEKLKSLEYFYSISVEPK